MKQQMLKERVELLEIAEWMGYPRMGFGSISGHKWSIRAGQPNWEKFCGHGHVTRIVTVLRNARVLRDNGVVPYNPRALPPVVIQVEPEVLRLVPGSGVRRDEHGTVEVGVDDLLAAIDEQPSVTRDDTVTPVRSAAAVRQQRFRDRKRSKA